MKIAVLSDIHANLPALRAVLEHVDSLAPHVVIVGGDVINRGPQPQECLDLVLDRVQHHGWRILKGNHEDYVLQAARGLAHLNVWERAVCAHSAWTAETVRDALPLIRSWPDQVEVTAPDGSHLICFHASRKGNRVGLYEFMGEEELREHVTGPASAICVGHTHVPFVRYVDGTLLVNSGAVGMPFDGDPRASYAWIEWSPTGWRAENMRVPYDRDETRAAYRSTGYLENGGVMVKLMMRELDEAAPWLGKWHRDYEADVVAGRMTVEASVEAILARPPG